MEFIQLVLFIQYNLFCSENKRKRKKTLIQKKIAKKQTNSTYFNAL